MIKRLLLLLFFLSISAATELSAQRFYEDKLYVFNWGYGRVNGTFNMPDGSAKKLSFGQMPLTYEFFSRHAYFHSDILSPIFDLCLGAFDSQYWWGHRRDGFIYKGGDWPLLRMGFGGYFGDVFGLYGGAQWSYSKWEVLGETNYTYLYDNVSQKQFGGHLYGLGLHKVLNFDKLLIRSSVMFDRVTDGFKGKSYTNALTWDVTALYGITHDNMISVFANYIYSDRKDVQLSKFRFGLALTFDR